MKEIPLTQSKVALVDDADFEWLSQWKWHAARGRCTTYAQRTPLLAEEIDRTVLMHRAILQAPVGMDVDHIDGNGLNNTRSNLRLVTTAENNRYRRKNAATTSGYKGVSFVKSSKGAKKVWGARILIDGVSRWLGLFYTPEDAAKAYDAAAIEAWGEFAYTNFQRSN